MSIHQICGVEAISPLHYSEQTMGYLSGPAAQTFPEDFHLGNIISSSQRYSELKNSTALEWILQDAVNITV